MDRIVVHTFPQLNMFLHFCFLSLYWFLPLIVSVNLMISPKVYQGCIYLPRNKFPPLKNTQRKFSHFFTFPISPTMSWSTLKGEDCILRPTGLLRCFPFLPTGSCPFAHALGKAALGWREIARGGDSLCRTMPNFSINICKLSSTPLALAHPQIVGWANLQSWPPQYCPKGALQCWSSQAHGGGDKVSTLEGRGNLLCQTWELNTWTIL